MPVYHKCPVSSKHVSPECCGGGFSACKFRSKRGCPVVSFLDDSDFLQPFDQHVLALVPRTLKKRPEFHGEPGLFFLLSLLSC
jgi:hypothetical protein